MWRSPALRRLVSSKNGHYRISSGTGLGAGRNYASQTDPHPSTSSASMTEPVVESSREVRPRGDSQMKAWKPTTPSIRWLRLPRNDHLHKGGPYRPLTIAKRKKGGRNNTGRITVRHRGGGHRQRIRIVDFHRYAPGTQTVQRIEYDPGRSAHLALLKHDETGKFSYMVACEGQRANDKVESYRRGIPQHLIEELGGQADPGMIAARTIKNGNCLPLSMIPVGTRVCCIGLDNFGPARSCRAAGSFGIILSTGDTGHAVLRMASGEIRKVPVAACATVGTISNPNWKHRKLGKAGRARWLGWRPSVRGTAMSPHDHPHGGGRGKSKGNKAPRSPWGTLKGAKTRKSKHHQNKLLIKARPRGKDKKKATA